MEETYRARYGGRGRVPSPSATLQICMRSPTSSPKAFQTPLENFCYHVSQYIQEKPGNGVSLPLALAQHIRRPRWRGVWTCSDVVPPQKPRSALPVPPAGGSCLTLDCVLRLSFFPSTSFDSPTSHLTKPNHSGDGGLCRPLYF